MNQINITDFGKKFLNEWIFREVNYTFNLNSPTAILGPNGSGKSTLLQCIAGILPTNIGSSTFIYSGSILKEEDIFRHISLVGPYTELIEEFTLFEIINFHTSFRKLKNGLSPEALVNLLGFTKHLDKPIKQFSSGMKQKLKLALSFYDESSVLLLDEPTSNLDEQVKVWYLEEIQKLITSKIIIISSNEPNEYSFCSNQVNILNYKLKSTGLNVKA